MQLKLIIILLLLTPDAFGITLRGVTIKNPPYIFQNPDESEKYYGYVVDLMDGIAKIARFNYTLYLVKDGKYGDAGLQYPDGMIGEVIREAADFAVADLTVTEDRKSLVKFTEGFMDLDLSALVRKDLIGNITTLEELLAHRDFTFSALKSGSTFSDLTGTNDPLLSRVYLDLQHGFIGVQSREEGINRTLNSKPNARYAFIQGSAANEYAMDRHCELTAIYSESQKYPREYAIALRRETLYLEKFNQAIRELKRDGTLDRLKHKYFHTNCLKSAAIRSTVNISVMFVGIIVCFVSFFAK